MLVFWMLSAPSLATDLNCNGILAEDEPPIDLSDPVCAANIDPATGSPFGRDAYHDYISYGCDALIGYSFDDDNDGLSSGQIMVGNILVNLSCDLCPSAYDPEQIDLDFDGIADSCHLFLDLPTLVDAGEEATFAIESATEGSEVVLAISNSLGVRSFPSCPDLEMELATPRKFASSIGDYEGVAGITGVIPPQSAGKTRYFQAIELDSCRTSNVLAVEF